MTDRINALIVVLEHDICDDDAEVTINAIKQIRGVLKVKPHIAEFADEIAFERARYELIAKLWAVLHGGDNGQA